MLARSSPVMLGRRSSAQDGRRKPSRRTELPPTRLPPSIAPRVVSSNRDRGITSIGAVMRIATLQWATGTFCGVIGAMMLVTPHQFESIAYDALRARLPWWGSAFVLAAGGLGAAATAANRRPVVVGAHIYAGAVLVLIGYGFASTGGVIGATAYGLLGVGTAVAPLVVGTERDGAAGRDLFELVVGASAAALGLVLVLRPDQVSAPMYDALRPYLSPLAMLLVLGGIALVYAHVRLVRRRIVWAGHLLLAAASGPLAPWFSRPK